MLPSRSVVAGVPFKMLKAGMINGIYLTVFAAADFANGLGGAGGFSAHMGTGISALFALAVFPFVVFLGDRNRAAAIPLLRMSLFVGAPNLFAGVVVGVYFAVFAAADFANGLGGAGGFSALMGTGISALFALAVFPFVVFLGDRNRAAAIPLLRMGLFIGAPNLFRRCGCRRLFHRIRFRRFRKRPWRCR